MGLFKKHTVLGKLFAPKAGGSTVGNVLRNTVGKIPVVGGVYKAVAGETPTIQQMEIKAANDAYNDSSAHVNEAPINPPPKISQDIKDAAGSALEGAKGGLMDWFFGTKAGQDAQNAGAKDWLKDNAMWLGGLAVVVIGGVIYFVKGTFFGFGGKKGRR